MRPVRWTRAARWGLPIACGCALVSACSTTAPISVPQASRLSVYLRDGPGAVDSVWIQINDITLVGDTSSVSVLAAPTGLINVTALQDSVTTLTAGQQVDSGSYNQVRFILGGAVLETTGGSVYTMGGATPPDGLTATGTLQCPSCAQSGLKVMMSSPVRVAGGNDSGLLLDFDVGQSFGHQAGHSGRWIMHPVIQGAQAAPGTITGGGVGGTIAGTVALGSSVVLPTCGPDSMASSLKDFVPLATSTTVTDSAGNPLVFSGQTDSTGVFQVHVLDFDTYTLGFQAQTPLDSTQIDWQATVTPTQAVLDSTSTMVDSVSYTITGASCASTTP